MTDQLYVLSFDAAIDDEKETITRMPLSVCTSISIAKSIADSFHGTPLSWEQLDPDESDEWWVSEAIRDQMTDGSYTTPISITSWWITPCELNDVLKPAWESAWLILKNS